MSFAPTTYTEQRPEDEPSQRWPDLIRVEWRGPGDLWAIVDGYGQCYSRTGHPRPEPSPSNRTVPYKRRYRFPLEEALIYAEAAIAYRDRRDARLRKMAADR